MQTETGVALFWGLALVAIVILYHSTKDRWNWKKIMKRFLLIPAFCIGAGLLVWLYQAAGEKIRNMPTKQVEFDGVKLGELRQDVLFNKGAPPIQKPWEEYQAQAKPRDLFEEYGIAADSKIKKNKTGNNSFSDVPEGFEVVSVPQENNKNADILHYGELQIFIIKNRASLIQKTCDVYQSLNGIQCGGSVKDLESKLGKSKLVTCSRDHLRRIYHYPNYQVAYGLTQNSVTEFIVYDNTLGKVVEAEGFEDC